MLFDFSSGLAVGLRTCGSECTRTIDLVGWISLISPATSIPTGPAPMMRILVALAISDWVLRRDDSYSARVESGTGLIGEGCSDPVANTHFYYAVRSYQPLLLDKFCDNMGKSEGRKTQGIKHIRRMEPR